MKKHLKYIDGTADKFWQIEVTDLTFTVTYGKNGTSGTTQEKAFDTAAECLKAAEKLLAEKIKKGYSESGEVVVSSEAATKPKTDKQADKKSDLQVILAEFDSIIADKKIEDLLPFLKEKADGNREALKTQIKNAKRNFKSSEDSPYNWAYLLGDVQARIITLATLALFDKTEVASSEEVFRELLGKINDKVVFDIVEWAKPNWIDAFLLDRIKKQERLPFKYTNLRLLEAHGLIQYNPELFGLAVCSYVGEQYEKHKNEQYSERKNEATLKALIEQLVNDEIAYQRDIPEIFNYETSIHTDSFWIIKNDTYESFSIWDKIYVRLLAENKIDRQFFIENCLQIQTKEWNNNLKHFFRKRLEELNLQPEELLSFQETIFTFFHAAYPPIVTYGMDYVKQFYQNASFNVASFLEWVSPMMMRSDCKTAIKNLLPILEKLDKESAPNGVGVRPYRKEISALIADIFVIPDMSLQERAAKSLLKIADVNDADLRQKLVEYAPLMQGQIKSVLSIFFAENDFLDADTEGYETYEFAPQQPLFLTKEVILPTDWNEILFQFGKFLSSNEVLDAEILLHVFTSQRHLFPPDFTEQLKPYFKQLENRQLQGFYQYTLSDFLRQKITHLNEKFKYEKSEYLQIKTFELFVDILFKVDNKIKINSKLPLLSMPTHEPYWVEPKVLMERLIAYQNAKEDIDRVDLCMAISRMPRENTEEAAQLLPQLDPDLAKLMAFCLGISQTIDISEPDSMFSGVSFVGENTQQTDNISLWAVAARTVYPQKTFSEFEKTHLSDVPFVLEPFNSPPYFKERWHEYKNYETNEVERSTYMGLDLHFNAPEVKPMPNYLLYSLDIFERPGTWLHCLNYAENAFYWHSVMPQNPEPLAFFLLKSACSNVVLNASTAELKGFLDIVTRPEFWFSDSTMLVFACCFFQEKKEIRFMASEVLLTLIQNQAIDVEKLGEKVAFLISEQYSALMRFVDAVVVLKDVSPSHNSALFLILDNVFKHLVLGEKMPTNFKKMVENYTDMLSKTGHKPSPEALNFFDKLSDNAALKGLIKEIKLSN